MMAAMPSDEAANSRLARRQNNSAEGRGIERRFLETPEGHDTHGFRAGEAAAAESWENIFRAACKFGRDDISPMRRFTMPDSPVRAMTSCVVRPALKDPADRACGPFAGCFVRPSLRH